MRTTLSNKFLFIFSIFLLMFLIFAFVYADGSVMNEKDMVMEAVTNATPASIP
jgi:hypothetical protein